MSEDIFTLLGRWEDWMSARGLADSTRRDYMGWLVRVGVRARKDPRHFEEDDVVEVLVSYDSRGASRGMILRALKCFYRWAEDRELLIDPTRHLPIKAPKLGPAPSLSSEEVRALLRAAFRRSKHRGWCLAFALGTGGRRESLCAVRREDIRMTDLGFGEVFFRLAKGGRTYSVPLGRMGRLAALHLSARGKPTLLGVGPGRLWQFVHDAERDSGVRAWPHLLRHVYGTRVYERTRDPMVTARLLGHADLSQVPRYVRIEDERLRVAVDRL